MSRQNICPEPVLAGNAGRASRLFTARRSASLVFGIAVCQQPWSNSSASPALAVNLTWLGMLQEKRNLERQHISFCEFPPGLSRACLGKMIILSIKRRKNIAFSQLHSNRPKTAETSAIRVS
jgi:hypothetical protein